MYVCMYVCMYTHVKSLPVPHVLHTLHPALGQGHQETPPCPCSQGKAQGAWRDGSGFSHIALLCRCWCQGGKEPFESQGAVEAGGAGGLCREEAATS